MGEEKNKLGKKELQKYREVLLKIRGKISGDLQHLEDDSLNKSQREASGDLSGYSLHMADMATDNFDLEFNLGLASNEQQSLNLVDHALRKIDDGTFGLCESCKKPIPQKRLMVVPHAPLCIKCQELQEGRKNRAQ
jgi:RNA polymerase-binding protein DksA